MAISITEARANVEELNFDGPVLIIGGPYGNLEATEAVLAAGAALGIPPERTICTGDTVAYCADPAATIRAAGTGLAPGQAADGRWRSR